jgi:D-sedoheptulose 7-phosphate isomerase
MAELCDVPVIVPSKITMKIQEAHLAIVHIFCMVVERFCFGDDFGQAAQNTAAILTKD